MDTPADDLLRSVIDILERLELRYFVTGSIAAMYYGEPRFTNDIDIVVDLSTERIPEFLSSFSADEYYLSEDALRHAVTQQGRCNVIHIASGLKIDIMVAADTLFNRSRFERAKRVQPALDLEARFASAEDVILKKMDFFREGGSEKHLRDITGIMMVSGDQLDQDYVESWADEMGLETIWRTIKYLVRQKQL